MIYTIEDINYIKSWLDKCIPVKYNKHIYYISSKNIQRQLKYNNILKDKKFKLDLNKLPNDTKLIIMKHIKYNRYHVVCRDLWNHFKYKYLLSERETLDFFDVIFKEIF